MKRLIALCLATALILFPTACSRSVPTKEDMLDTAVKLVNYELLGALELDPIQSIDFYAGKLYIYSECVKQVLTDHVVLDYPAGSGLEVHACLSQEELNSLRTGMFVTVVGSADNILYDKDRLVYIVEMKTAYLVRTTSVVSGTIMQKSTKNGLPFCRVGGTAVFLPSDVLDTLQVGDSITAEGAITYDDTPFPGPPDIAPPEWDMKGAVLAEK